MPTVEQRKPEVEPIPGSSDNEYLNPEISQPEEVGESLEEEISDLDTVQETEKLPVLPADFENAPVQSPIQKIQRGVTELPEALKAETLVNILNGNESVDLTNATKANALTEYANQLQEKSSDAEGAELLGLAKKI